MAKTIEEWMKSGEYLPHFMRDFHDQKDLFKAIHQIIDVKGHNYCKEMDFVSGQCYVIDIFLWFMAKRGYTLQKTRKRGEFNDLLSDIEEQTERRQKVQAEALKAWLAPKETL